MRTQQQPGQDQQQKNRRSVGRALLFRLSHVTSVPRSITISPYSYNRENTLTSKGQSFGSPMPTDSKHFSISSSFGGQGGVMRRLSKLPHSSGLLTSSDNPMCAVFDEADAELYGEEVEEEVTTMTSTDETATPLELSVDVVMNVDMDVIDSPTVVEWWQGGCDYNTSALLTHAARTLLPMMDEQLTSDMGDHSHATMCALYMVF